MRLFLESWTSIYDEKSKIFPIFLKPDFRFFIYEKWMSRRTAAPISRLKKPVLARKPKHGATG
jgi:hypothetical protein